MLPSYDPDHGELTHVVGHLASHEAEMIAGDLHDLKIPAVVRQQRVLALDPETEQEIEVESDTFEILVPDAFLQITEEVLDATHLRREGDAPHAEILDELYSEEELSEEVAFETAPLLRNSNQLGNYLLRVLLVCAVLAFGAVLWRAFR